MGRWADGQTGSSRGADRILAISDVTVIPMDRERTLLGYTIIISGGSETRLYRIVRMGPADQSRFPPGLSGSTEQAST